MTVNLMGVKRLIDEIWGTNMKNEDYNKIY